MIMVMMIMVDDDSDDGYGIPSKGAQGIRRV